MRVARDPNRRRAAVAAAVGVARRLGLPAADPAVLHDGSNVLVHLRPASVVARVPTTTALVRVDPAEHLAREVALTRRLCADGAPILGPAEGVDPGPHRDGASVLTLWPLVDTALGPPAMDEVGRSLAVLHRALARVAPAELAPPAAPLHPARGETDLLLRRLHELGVLDGDDEALLRAEHARVGEALAASPLPVQPLHGDAHARNVLATADGPLWFDFEDCCVGPVAWDLACLVAPSALAAEPALEAYAAAGGAIPSADRLEPFLDARELQVVAWSLLFATRFPEVQEPARRRIEDLRRRLRR
jgi:aminoglycoside phosphotransferase (APT) family kinase protein